MLKFWSWYDREREELSTREVERRAGATYGIIGNAYKKRITYDVAVVIAKGLRIPEETVLREAGLLPADIVNEHELQQLLEYGRNLSPAGRELLLEYAWFLIQRQKSKG